MNEANGIKHSVMKEKARKQSIRRVRITMETELNPKHIMTPINTLAMPILTYSFTIIKWNLNELKEIDEEMSQTAHMQ